MLRIALTGGIATGKTYVLRELQRRGVPCLDSDALVHGITSAGTEATAAIADRFGGDILTPDGAVDRGKLGPVVFADPAARAALEAIVHPAVYRAIEAGLRGFEVLGGHAFAVVDVPLLYETGAQDKFDRVVVTACSQELQLARLRERGISDTEARQRIAAQWPTDEKASRADFVIRTDGTFDDTNRQIDDLLATLT